MGQILDRAVRLYRKHFFTFIGIVAAVQVPITIIQLVLNLINIPRMLELSERMNDPQAYADPFQAFMDAFSASSGGGIAVLVGLLSFILIQGIATAALVRAISDGYLGEEISLGGSYRRISNVWAKLLGVLILSGLLILGLAIYTIIPCLGWLTGPGIIMFYYIAIAPLIPITLVIEGQQGFNAIRRAWDLTRRRFWWVVGFTLLLGVFAWVVLNGPVYIINLVLNLFTSDLALTNMEAALAIQTIASSLTTLIFSLLYMPLQMTAIILMYFDLRVRTEAFDLTMLTAADDEEAAEAGDIARQAPRAETGNLVSWEEMGKFTLIALGLLVLYGIMVGIVMLIGFSAMSLQGY
jgi:hypothetical protein